MTWTVAPAARAALDQADALAPGRDSRKDGTVGDLAHSTRASWHNPNVRRQTVRPQYDPAGEVLAFDVTHDPDSGFDAHAQVRAAVERDDPRIYEAISCGRIWTRLRADEGWRPYGGSNPHTEHAHVSLTWAHRDDTSPWWLEEDEDVMSPAQEAKLDRVLALLEALVAPRRPDHKDVDPKAVSLGDVLTGAEKAARK